MYRVDKKELLFDNLEDPNQTHNLAKNADYTPIKESLKRKMQENMSRIGDKFKKNSYYKTLGEGKKNFAPFDASLKYSYELKNLLFRQVFLCS